MKRWDEALVLAISEDDSLLPAIAGRGTKMMEDEVQGTFEVLIWLLGAGGASYPTTVILYIFKIELHKSSLILKKKLDGIHILRHQRMGGISFILYNMTNPPIDIETMKGFMAMKNRGPDDTSWTTESSAKINRMNEEQVKLQLSRRELAEYKPFTFMFGFHRLCVNDMTLDASQPFEDPIRHQILRHPELRTRPKRKLMCNGEIYNYKDIKDSEGFVERDLQSSSDVEVILPLYIKYGLEKTLDKLNGDFSFVLTENLDTFDVKQMQVFVVRDRFGSKSLYMVKHKTEHFYMFVSELKSVPKNLMYNDMYEIREVPPGSYWSFQNSVVRSSSNDFISYWDWTVCCNPDYCTISSPDPETLVQVYGEIQKLVTKSVIERFTTSGRGVGILLSGGFDSSIIMSIIVKHLLSSGHDFNQEELHVFTVGDDDSLDVKAACMVISYLEDRHNINLHHHVVSVDSSAQLISEIDNAIYTLETYDPRSIKAALPFSLLLKYISEKTDVKVLMSGDGLDEICGYHKLFAHGDDHFQHQSGVLIENISKFDLLRTDKIAASYGLEMRHPFLDREFVEYMFRIHPRLKRPQAYKASHEPIEKYIVRKAFDISRDEGYLEHDILWRKICDESKCLQGVGGISQYFEQAYSNYEFAMYVSSLKQRPRHVGVMPTSKEEMHYRKVFEKLFPNSSGIMSCFWRHLWVQSFN